MTDFAPLARRQLDSPDANNCIFLIFSFESQWKLAVMNFLKLSWIANRRADTETNIETNRWTQKSKNL